MYELDMIEIDIDNLLDTLKQGNLVSNDAFTRRKTSNNNRMSCCPYHHETRPSFGIMLEYPYMFQCYSCGVKGTVLNLIAHCLKLTYEEAFKWLTKNQCIYISENTTIDLAVVFKEQINHRPTLDPIVLNQYSSIHPFVTKRGFDKDVLIKFNIGYDPKYNAITIPMWDLKGNLRYIKRRFINPRDDNKYFNESNVYKRDILYLLHFIKKAGIRDIFLVEGEFDALAMYQMGLPAVATGTSKITSEQIKALLNASILNITVLYDSDKWGVIGSEKVAKKLNDHFVTSIGQLPSNCGDPNDLLIRGDKKDIKIKNIFNFQLKI